MEKEALYWILSTLPQVSAALVAFIGFLALQSLDEPSRRRTEFVDKSRKHVRDYCEAEGWKNFVTRTWYGIEVMSRDDLAREIDSLLDASLPDDANTRTPFVVLRDYRREWRIVDQQINWTQRVLKGFVSIHLLVILGTLSLIPYIPRLAPRLAGYPWIEEAVVATALLMVVTVGIMIFVALKPSAN
jgi:hypothetical protein